MTANRSTFFRILWGSQFLSVKSSMVVAPMLPFYMERLGARDEASVLMWSGLSLAAPAVSAALTAPLWGRLGDRTSRKWMIVRALLMSAVVFTAMGFAQTPFHLFALRLLHGALGGVVDAVGAYAAAEAEAGEQGRVRGRLEGALAAGSMLGPLLGGSLLGLTDFRHVFLLLGGLLGVWTLLAAWGLKETGKRRTDWPTSARTSPPAAMSAQLGRLFGERRVRIFLCAGMAANFGTHGLLTVLPLHVQAYAQSAEATALWVGILQAVNWASVWLSSAWWGRRNDTHPVERNFTLAAWLCGLSILLQAVAPNLVFLLLLRILQGFAASALLQSVYLTVTRASADGQLGARLGLTRSMLFAGQIAGPLAGGLAGGILSAASLFAVHGIVISLGGAIVRVFGMRERASHAAGSPSPDNG